MNNIMKGAAVTAAMVGILVAGGPAVAEEQDGLDKAIASVLGSVSAEVAITSNYMFRGLTQTDNSPAIQGGLGFTRAFEISPGYTMHVSGNVWASNVNFKDGDEASIELDYSGAIGITHGPLTAEALLIYYTYPGASRALKYDFVEYGAALTYDAGFASLTGTYLYSPDFFGGIGSAHYVAADLSVPLPYKFSVDGHVGHSSFRQTGARDYVDWSIGVSRPVYGVDLSLAYVDNDLPGRLGNVVVFTAGMKF